MKRIAASILAALVVGAGAPSPKDPWAGIVPVVPESPGSSAPALQPGDGNQATAAAPRAQTGHAQQAAFCQEIEDADRAYEPQNAAWYASTNDITRDRLTSVLAHMRDERDQAILEIAGAARPTMSGWTLTLTRLTTFDKALDTRTAHFVSLTLNAGCKNDVTIETEFELADRTEDLLAASKPGTKLLVSGAFLGHDDAYNATARALDWNLFEHGAMQDPTYRVAVTSITSAP